MSMDDTIKKIAASDSAKFAIEDEARAAWTAAAEAGKVRPWSDPKNSKGGQGEDWIYFATHRVAYEGGKFIDRETGLDNLPALLQLLTDARPYLEPRQCGGRSGRPCVRQQPIPDRAR